MKAFSAALLFITIVVTVLVAWVPAKWATTIPETAFSLTAALWCVSFLARKRNAKLSVVLIPTSAIVLWAVFQLIAGSTVYAWQTRMAILYWAGNLAALFIGLQLFDDANLRSRFVRALMAFGFIISVVSTLQGLTTQAKVFWLFQTGYRGWLVFGPFVYHNQYAAFIELLLPIALFHALTDAKGRLFYILIAATMYASVIAAASRAGFVLTTAELLLVPAVIIRRWKVPVELVLGAGGALAAMVVLLAVSAGPGLLLGRFGLRDPVRLEFLYSSLGMIKDRPLMGVGLGNWATAYPGYALFDDGKYANQAHNDWAQWTVEGGIPLLAIMLFFALWTAPRAIRTGWGAGVAAIFVHCAIDYPIQRTAVAALFFVMIAAVAQTRDAREISYVRKLRDGLVTFPYFS